MAGCGPKDATPTGSQTFEPSLEPTNTEAEISFTPSPEPSILVSLSRGETVARIQKRLKDLGYLHYRPTGYFLDMTQTALKAFQQDTGNLVADGTAGKETLDELFNVAYPARKNTSSIPGQESPEYKEPGLFGNRLTWESVSQLLQEGARFDVWDFESDITLRMQRTGGTNHMHAEPLTQSDTDALSAMFSKIISGEKRPVLIRFEGQTIASSMYGAPHGQSSISENGCDGIVCIFFLGCTDEDYGMADAEHNENINRASGQEQ